MPEGEGDAHARAVVDEGHLEVVPDHAAVAHELLERATQRGARAERVLEEVEGAGRLGAGDHQAEVRLSRERDGGLPGATGRRGVDPKVGVVELPGVEARGPAHGRDVRSALLEHLQQAPQAPRRGRRPASRRRR